ncbi:MAG TPA: mechanosensitive ion channel domain-containing protein [Glycomyces sp.]|nr:mechanosensitive ion channel domain-containing protein [Glycomyces sp.]
MPLLAPWVIITIVAIGCALAVSAAKLLTTRLMLRHRSANASRLIGKALRPAQLMAVTGGLQILLSAQHDKPGWGGEWNEVLSQSLLFGTAASGAWLLSNLLAVAKDPIHRRWDGLEQNDVEGRRRRTQAVILYRLASVIVWTVAIGLVLFNIPALREVGVSMLGAAGVAGIIAGLAAQTMLQNLFAGMTLAFGDAVRLDDVVVIENELGTIEEITLTYLVVRIWDDRRMVLPTSYFMQNTYVNWTRDTPEVLGTVQFDATLSLPVDEVRFEVTRFLADHPLWDGRKGSVAVLDATGGLLRVRILISAKSPGDQWDLRCEMREHIAAWLVKEHPDCIPNVG